jgi:hypothetical protein
MAVNASGHVASEARSEGKKSKHEEVLGMIIWSGTSQAKLILHSSW